MSRMTLSRTATHDAVVFLFVVCVPAADIKCSFTSERVVSILSYAKMNNKQLPPPPPLLVNSAVYGLDYEIRVPASLSSRLHLFPSLTALYRVSNVWEERQRHIVYNISTNTQQEKKTKEKEEQCHRCMNPLPHRPGRQHPPPEVSATSSSSTSENVRVPDYFSHGPPPRADGAARRKPIHPSPSTTAPTPFEKGLHSLLEGLPHLIESDGLSDLSSDTDSQRPHGIRSRCEASRSEHSNPSASYTPPPPSAAARTLPPAGCRSDHMKASEHGGRASHDDTEQTSGFHNMLGFLMQCCGEAATSFPTLRLLSAVLEEEKETPPRAPAPAPPATAAVEVRMSPVMSGRDEKDAADSMDGALEDVEAARGEAEEQQEDEAPDEPSDVPEVVAAVEVESAEEAEEDMEAELSEQHGELHEECMPVDDDAVEADDQSEEEVEDIEMEAELEAVELRSTSVDAAETADVPVLGAADYRTEAAGASVCALSIPPQNMLGFLMQCCGEAATSFPTLRLLSAVLEEEKETPPRAPAPPPPATAAVEVRMSPVMSGRDEKDAADSMDGALEDVEAARGEAEEQQEDEAPDEPSDVPEVVAAVEVESAEEAEEDMEAELSEQHGELHEECMPVDDDAVEADDQSEEEVEDIEMEAELEAVELRSTSVDAAETADVPVLGAADYRTEAAGASVCALSIPPQNMLGFLMQCCGEAATSFPTLRLLSAVLEEEKETPPRAPAPAPPATAAVEVRMSPVMSGRDEKDAAGSMDGALEDVEAARGEAEEQQEDEAPDEPSDVPEVVAAVEVESAEEAEEDMEAELSEQHGELHEECMPVDDDAVEADDQSEEEVEDIEMEAELEAVELRSTSVDAAETADVPVLGAADYRTEAAGASVCALSIPPQNMLGFLMQCCGEAATSFPTLRLLSAVLEEEKETPRAPAPAPPATAAVEVRMSPVMSGRDEKDAAGSMDGALEDVEAARGEAEEQQEDEAPDEPSDVPEVVAAVEVESAEEAEEDMEAELSEQHGELHEECMPVDDDAVEADDQSEEEVEDIEMEAELEAVELRSTSVDAAETADVPVLGAADYRTEATGASVCALSIPPQNMLGFLMQCCGEAATSFPTLRLLSAVLEEEKETPPRAPAPPPPATAAVEVRMSPVMSGRDEKDAADSMDGALEDVEAARGEAEEQQEDEAPDEPSDVPEVVAAVEVESAEEAEEDMEAELSEQHGELHEECMPVDDDAVEADDQSEEEVEDIEMEAELEAVELRSTSVDAAETADVPVLGAADYRTEAAGASVCALSIPPQNMLGFLMQCCGEAATSFPTLRLLSAVLEEEKETPPRAPAPAPPATAAVEVRMSPVMSGRDEKDAAGSMDGALEDVEAARGEAEEQQEDEAPDEPSDVPEVVAAVEVESAEEAEEDMEAELSEQHGELHEECMPADDDAVEADDQSEEEVEDIEMEAEGGFEELEVGRTEDTSRSTGTASSGPAALEPLCSLVVAVTEQMSDERAAQEEAMDRVPLPDERRCAHGRRGSRWEEGKISAGQDANAWMGAAAVAPELELNAAVGIEDRREMEMRHSDNEPPGVEVVQEGVDAPAGAVVPTTTVQQEDEGAAPPPADVELETATQQADAGRDGAVAGWVPPLRCMLDFVAHRCGDAAAQFPTLTCMANLVAENQRDGATATTPPAAADPSASRSGPGVPALASTPEGTGEPPNAPAVVEAEPAAGMPLAKEGEAAVDVPPAAAAAAAPRRTTMGLLLHRCGEAPTAFPSLGILNLLLEQEVGGMEGSSTATPQVVATEAVAEPPPTPTHSIAQAEEGSETPRGASKAPQDAPAPAESVPPPPGLAAVAAAVARKAEAAAAATASRAAHHPPPFTPAEPPAMKRRSEEEIDQNAPTAAAGAPEPIFILRTADNAADDEHDLGPSVPAHVECTPHNTTAENAAAATAALAGGTGVLLLPHNTRTSRAFSSSSGSGGAMPNRFYHVDDAEVPVIRSGGSSREHSAERDRSPAGSVPPTGPSGSRPPEARTWSPLPPSRSPSRSLSSLSTTTASASPASSPSKRSSSLRVRGLSPSAQRRARIIAALSQLDAEAAAGQRQQMLERCALKEQRRRMRRLQAAQELSASARVLRSLDPSPQAVRISLAGEPIGSPTRPSSRRSPIDEKYYHPPTREEMEAERAKQKAHHRDSAERRPHSPRRQGGAAAAEEKEEAPKRWQKIPLQEKELSSEVFTGGASSSTAPLGAEMSGGSRTLTATGSGAAAAGQTEPLWALPTSPITQMLQSLPTTTTATAPSSAPDAVVVEAERECEETETVEGGQVAAARGPTEAETTAIMSRRTTLDEAHTTVTSLQTVAETARGAPVTAAEAEVKPAATEERRIDVEALSAPPPPSDGQEAPEAATSPTSVPGTAGAEFATPPHPMRRKHRGNSRKASSKEVDYTSDAAAAAYLRSRGPQGSCGSSITTLSSVGAGEDRPQKCKSKFSAKFFSQLTGDSDRERSYKEVVPVFSDHQGQGGPTQRRSIRDLLRDQVCATRSSGDRSGSNASSRAESLGKRHSAFLAAAEADVPRSGSRTPSSGTTGSQRTGGAKAAAGRVDPTATLRPREAAGKQSTKSSSTTTALSRSQSRRGSSSLGGTTTASSAALPPLQRSNTPTAATTPSRSRSTSALTHFGVEAIGSLGMLVIGTNNVFHRPPPTPHRTVPFLSAAAQPPRSSIEGFHRDPRGAAATSDVCLPPGPTAAAANPPPRSRLQTRTSSCPPPRSRDTSPAGMAVALHNARLDSLCVVGNHVELVSRRPADANARPPRPSAGVPLPAAGRRQRHPAVFPFVLPEGYKKPLVTSRDTVYPSMTRSRIGLRKSPSYLYRQTKPNIHTQLSYRLLCVSLSSAAFILRKHREDAPLVEETVFFLFPFFLFEMVRNSSIARCFYLAHVLNNSTKRTTHNELQLLCILMDVLLKDMVATVEAPSHPLPLSHSVSFPCCLGCCASAVDCRRL
eukprot:gene888-517_t